MVYVIALGTSILVVSLGGARASPMRGISAGWTISKLTAPQTQNAEFDAPLMVGSMLVLILVATWVGHYRSRLAGIFVNVTVFEAVPLKTFVPLIVASLAI